jgi:hypothetical protein
MAIGTLTELTDDPLAFDLFCFAAELRLGVPAAEELLDEEDEEDISFELDFLGIQRKL